MLSEYIEHENMQVRTYINGTLYSLFTRPALKEQARALGIPEMLKHLLASADPQIARQLGYIMDQLEAEPVEECVSDDNEGALDFEDDDNYDTEVEEEVDTDILNAGVPTGEQLLHEFGDPNLIPSTFPTPVKGRNMRTSTSSSTFDR